MKKSHKLFLEKYSEVLKSLDKTYINENRAIDKKGIQYENPGICFEMETHSRTRIHNKMFGDKWKSEQSYFDIGADSVFITNRKTKLDTFLSEPCPVSKDLFGNDKYTDVAIEGKKLHFRDNKGGLDENVYKKMTCPMMLGSGGWTDIVNGKSNVSLSILGDADKLITLPQTTGKFCAVEFHFNSGDMSSLKPYITEVFKHTMETYFNCDTSFLMVEDLIHPYMNTCIIMLIEIYNRR